MSGRVQTDISKRALLDMGKLSWVEQRMRDGDSYDEAASRLRMSVLCRDCVRPLAYPLFMRILEHASTRGTSL